MRLNQAQRANASKVLANVSVWYLLFFRSALQENDILVSSDQLWEIGMIVFDLSGRSVSD